MLLSSDMKIESVQDIKRWDFNRRFRIKLISEAADKYVKQVTNQNNIKS